MIGAYVADIGLFGEFDEADIDLVSLILLFLREYEVIGFNGVFDVADDL